MDKFYDPVKKIIEVPDVEDILDPHGFGNLLFNKMKKHSSKIAQIDPNTGDSNTYDEYFWNCVRTAIEMRNLGIKKGDIITICSHNHLTSAVPFVAAYFIGAITTTLDPSLSLDDTKYLVNLVKPKMIFASELSENLIMQAILYVKCNTSIVVFGKSETNLMFEDFLKQKENEDCFKPQSVHSLEDICSIIFSSGTTGLPKGICLSHKFLLKLQSNSSLPVSSGYASLYWISTTYCTLTAILQGKIRYMLCYYNPNLLWEYLQNYDIKDLFMSPSDVLQLIYTKPKSYSVKLNILSISGGQLTKENIYLLRQIFPKTEIRFIFGCSELFVTFDSTLRDDKAPSVGTPIHGRTYKIVDPETEETLGFNKPGELRIKTDYRTSGYYQMDSSSIFDSEGYVKTGDIAYYDEEFYFYIIDRIKEIFKYKSWHIVPAKLESILLRHPDVETCAIVGVPHPEDDNHILAVVKLRNKIASVEDIRNYVDQQVDDRHKLRAGVRIINDFPITPTGKIKRKELAKLFY